MLLLIAALLVPTCAHASPALPKARLHLRIEPGVGPPGVPPTATILVELVWTFDPGRRERRRSMLRQDWELDSPWAFRSGPGPAPLEPGELPWLPGAEPVPDEPGDLP